MRETSELQETSFFLGKSKNRKYFSKKLYYSTNTNKVVIIRMIDNQSTSK